MFPWGFSWNIVYTLEHQISRKKSTGAIQVKKNKISSPENRTHEERLKKPNVFSLVSSDM